MNPEKILIEKAMEAAGIAYAPYSRYHVGAALLTENGEIFTGCNIENASFGATNCAERTAFFKAVSQGYLDFTAIAIVGGSVDEKMVNEDEAQTGGTAGKAAVNDNRPKFSDYAYPCGICRQVMQEFCNGDFKIIIAKNTEDYKEYTLGGLLPFGFGGCRQ